MNEETPTFEHFVVDVIKYYADNSENVRIGQAFVNKLWEVKPALQRYTEEHSHLDPFYDDSKVEAFLLKIAQLWNAPWSDFSLAEYAMLRWSE